MWCSNNMDETLPPIDINVIDGIILPEPSDPRWWNNKNDREGVMTLGKIEVFCDRILFDRMGPLHNWIHDKATENNKISRYYIAICNELANRASEDSILHAKMPPKNRKTKEGRSEVKALTPICKIPRCREKHGYPVPNVEGKALTMVNSTSIWADNYIKPNPNDNPFY